MIGIFDSGIGGVTYLDALHRYMPDVDTYYFGDTLNVPYGDRSSSEIVKLADEGIQRFQNKGCSLVIVACNTIASEALRILQARYDRTIKILGVLIPASEQAIEVSSSKRIGVLGTKQTIRSQAYERELSKLDVNVRVYGVAAPEIVPLIERGEYDSQNMENILRSYLSVLIASEVDTIILGCTHYNILENIVQKIVPSSVKIVNSSQAAVEKLSPYLHNHKDIAKMLCYTGKMEIDCSGDREIFLGHVKTLFPHLLV